MWRDVMARKDEKGLDMLRRGAVVDASALIGGMAFSGEFPLFISPLVEKEVEGVKGVDLLKAARLEVRRPSERSLAVVVEAAKVTGDDARISMADAEVLALAIELDLPILTDDYSIQNVARHIGIVHIPIGERGIRKEIKWTYRCRGCGRYFDTRPDDCPVCGSEIRSSRARK